MKIARVFIGLAASAWLLSSSVQSCAQAPVPPPAEQWTADCSRPVYASDHLLCADSELQAWDARLAQALQGHSPLNAGNFIEDNSQWFKRRSRCAFESDHRGCLLDAYSDRVAIVEGAVMDPVRTLAAQCRTLGAVTFGMLPSGHISLRSQDSGTLVAIAHAPARGSAWKPMLRFTQTGRAYIFKSYDGRKFTCKTNR